MSAVLPDRATIRNGLGAIAAIAFVGLAFIASYVGALHDPRPHEVPVAVAGPPPLAAQIGRGGSFDARRVADAPAAARAIDDRDAYASVVAAADATTVTVAPGAGAAVADVVRATIVPELRRGGQKVRVRVVHPLAAGDARGLSAFYLAIGLVVTGYLAATFLGLIFTPRPSRLRTVWRLAAIALLAIVAGLLGPLVVHLLGALPGSYLAAAGLAALTVLAVGAATVALQSAFGIIGTGVAIMVFVVLGNPAAGGAYPIELMPGLWRAVGPYIPVGATTGALRNVAYFSGSATLGSVIVLIVWGVLGCAVALALGNRRGRLSQQGAEQMVGDAVSS